MSPRQRLTPRCSAKPTRHPAHPDVHPHAVSKRQLTLRFDEIDGNGISGNAYNPNFDTNVLFCTPPGGPKPPDHPAHRYVYDDVDKDDNDKYDLHDDVFNPKGKTNGFLNVFVGHSSSTFKDDKLEEKK